jgi:hypothetical protein
MGAFVFICLCTMFCKSVQAHPFRRSVPGPMQWSSPIGLICSTFSMVSLKRKTGQQHFLSPPPHACDPFPHHRTQATIASSSIVPHAYDRHGSLHRRVRSPRPSPTWQRHTWPHPALLHDPRPFRCSCRPPACSCSAVAVLGVSVYSTLHMLSNNFENKWHNKLLNKR